LGALVANGGSSLVDLRPSKFIDSSYAAALPVSSSVASRAGSVLRIGCASTDNLDVLDDVPIAILSDE
jgi:hypothetical protein